jgi:hypothetical protein
MPIPEKSSGTQFRLGPTEKELPERRSDAFRHKIPLLLSYRFKQLSPLLLLQTNTNMSFPLNHGLQSLNLS